MTNDWYAVGVEAARCLREGRYEDAAAGFERLVAMRDDHADSWFNLGYARRMARQYQQALDAYGEALDRGVSSPEEVHLNRAVILSEHLHRAGDALAELRQAVAKNPGAVAAWLNLGNLHEDLGDPAAATEAYQAALAADPRNGRAIARLAAIQVYQGEPERAIASLREAVERTRPGTEDAAEICLALASALDATGDYRSAFAAAAEGKAISAALRTMSNRYNRSAHESLIDSLIEAFPEPAAGSADTGADDQVVFICGMFRSGSTLAEQLLARHPAVTAGGELEFIPALVKEDLEPYPAALAQAPADRMVKLRDKYLEQVRALYPDARIVTDKRPDNFLHVGLIKTLFPNARVLHTVRHPLDNILSLFFLNFAETVSYSERLEDIVHYYGQYRRLMSHWERLYGGDLHTIDYDRLVSDPRPVLEDALGFLNLEWDDACLDQDLSRAAVRTASNWQVRQPLHERSSGRWRNYAAELEPVHRELIAMGLLAESKDG